MKELEEVNCETRRIVPLQFPVLRNECSQSTNLQEHDNASDCRGGFLHNATYAWISSGCHLVVFNVKSGESISSWVFRDVVTSVSQFPAQSGEFPLLLVGVDNCASKLKDSFGLLCIFDCTTSRVLRAIRMPCGIEQVCVVAGGAEWEEFNDKRPDNVLSEMDGMACVALRNLHHIMIDLRRTVWDTRDSSVFMDEGSPAEIDFPSMKQIVGRHQSVREKHIAYNLLNNRIEKHIGFNRQDFESSPLLGESLTTTIISSTKIGCLISGCLGRVIIWQNDGSVGWISTPIDANMTVTHLALLEPTDDPRPFYYLWVVFQDELSKAPPILRMYAMLFERKYCNQEVNLYFNLEDDPSLKFELELNEGDKVVSLCAIEREANPEQTESAARRGEDNLLLIATTDRVFLFDLNQWYKEQMPHTITECQNPNSILATCRIRSDVQNEKDSQIINFAYIPHSLQEFSSNGPSLPEELFHPNSLSLEWIELNSTKLTFWMTRGIQTDLLREIATAGPVVLIHPFETFQRCLSVGLVPFNSEFSFASDLNAQREMLLSLCLEQRWSTFLIKCAMEWSDGSASYLYPTFFKWAIQRASTIKMIADRLCIPLFDQSGNSIGEADVKTLRFCSQQLECLSNVVGKLPSATMDLIKQRRTLRRVSIYFQVLLWFYDVGLLPETQNLEEGEEEDDEEKKTKERTAMMQVEAEMNTETEEEEEKEEREEKIKLPISLALKVPYPYEKLSVLYKEKRAQFLKNIGSNNKKEQDLFIDELIMRECSILKAQWEREGGIATHGCYPPPSLQSLLRSYLTDCHQTEANEINCRHQITIYLLMDLAMLLQRLYPAVKQLIKYPSAFIMSPSLIKLTQAFWLLDHKNYQEFLDTITGQLVCDSDIKDWHHRLVLRTLIYNNQHKLALVYLRVRKPPLSSMEEQGVAMSLSVEYGLVQSAFHRRPPCYYEQLLASFFQACRKYGKLNEILHLVLDSEEEEVFVKFLEENKMEDLRLLYYLQRCRYTEVIGGYPIRQSQMNLTKNVQSMSIRMLGAYDVTLPDVTKQFSTNAITTSSDTDLKARYSRPMSHRKSHDRFRNIYETVVTKARETYLRGEKCHIPFVSAPCTSLKLNSYSVNMNCVVFPELMRKNHGKRTIDQVYKEGEENDMSKDIKRQRLLDENVSPSKLVSKESGFQETFNTPLVKRKFINTSTNKDPVLETPQSILKIRQLVRSSMSPSEITQANEAIDRLSEKEKKINRQIRFNINQSKKALMYEEEQEEEEEDLKDEDEDEDEEIKEKEKEKREREEKEKLDENETNDSHESNSNDAFFSPSANKSACSESAILSNDSSNISDKKYYYARPRPSLRRSALQSSAEMSHESCAKKANDSPANLSMTTFDDTSKRARSELNILDASERHNSLLSASVYSASILSPDTSIDVSCLKKSEPTSPSQHRLSIGGNGNIKFIMSSTPLTKMIISKRSVKDKRALEVDESNNAGEMVDEDLNTLSEFKKSDRHVDRTDYIESELAEQKGNLEKVIETESQNAYNNGRSSSIVSEKLDKEILEPQDDKNDNEEQEETFESLPMISEDTQMHLDSGDSASCIFHETWNLERKTEEACNVTKPNGLQDSAWAIGDVDLTDDESVNSRTTTPAIPDNQADDNKKETHLMMPIIHSEHVLYDASNITDDESDSNIGETEELKAKNGRYSNVQEPYISTWNTEVEKNDESNEKSRKVNRKESVSKKNLDKSSSRLSDVNSDKSNKILVPCIKLHKIDSKNIEAFNKSEHERELSNPREAQVSQSFSEYNKKNEIETTDVFESIRMTRSRRAGSASRDTPTPQRDNTLEKINLRRRSSITTKNSSMDRSFQEAVVEKSTRLRRANSIAKEIENSPRGNSRNRRASSLAKDVLMSSMRMDESLELQSGNTSVQPSPKRGRRCASVAKEMLRSQVEDSDHESVKDEQLPVRRSTRLASSARRESQADESFGRSESMTSLTKLMSDDEESENTSKRPFRRSARKSSVSSDTDAMNTSINVRSLRSFTRNSREKITEEPAKEQDIKTDRKRRGSSVPKETTTQLVTSRRYRSGSVINEIIPEVAESSQEEEFDSKRSSKKPAVENDEEIDWRLTANARTRSASMLSVPEELEEILSPSIRETRANKKKALQNNVRERRAFSADVTHTEIKRRVKSMKVTSIAVAPPIAEELTEDEDRAAESGKDEAVDDGTTQSASTLEKRTPATNKKTKETETKGIIKAKRGRPRKTSAKSGESSNLFSFSLPEGTDDVLLDEKDIGKVPNYVFSPPQTRSKNTVSNQHQK
ncbi:hypothetical protein PUN28_011177 [Cardiocondyla obscurior]|uniref:ELYS-like domain-containing protein n=1 Tax=Cardiocondyla obscurior TaxID=286306 RepID=A0AAW2FQE9_9HYME